MIVEDGDWGVGVDISQYTEDGDEDIQDDEEYKETPMFPPRHETDRGKVNQTQVSQRLSPKSRQPQTPQGFNDDDKTYVHDLGTRR